MEAVQHGMKSELPTGWIPNILKYQPTLGQEIHGILNEYLA